MSYTYKTSAFMLLVVINYVLLIFTFPTIVAVIPMPALVLFVLNQMALFLLPIILYFVVTKDNFKSTLTLNPLGVKNSVYVVIIALAIQPTMLILSLISTLLFPNTVVGAMENQTLTTLLIGMSLAPAIFEEVVFRGIIYGNLKKSQPFWKAALLTGLFFGIIHFSGQQFLYAFMSGALFCFLVKKTNSLFSSVLAHFTINASQSFLFFIESMYAQKNGINLSTQTTGSVAEISGVIPFLLFITAISIPFLILSFKGLYQIVPENDEDIISHSGEQIISIPFVIIVAIYMLFISISHFY